MSKQEVILLSFHRFNFLSKRFKEVADTVSSSNLYYLEILFFLLKSAVCCRVLKVGMSGSGVASDSHSHDASQLSKALMAKPGILYTMSQKNKTPKSCP